MNDSSGMLLSGSDLPAFATLEPDGLLQTLDSVLQDNRGRLAEILAQQGTPAWETLVEPLDELDEAVSRVWGPLAHLFGVTSSAAWRKAFNQALPKVTEYGLELSQSEPLFEAYRRLAASPAYQDLSPVRQRVIEHALRDFKLSGVSLPVLAKERFKALSLSLSEAQTRFEENLMDAIQAYEKPISDEALLDGMTPEALRQAASKARERNLPGWLLTLDFPSFDAVISHARNRELREELYRAYATRASDQGPLAGRHDNTALIEEILALRHEQAQLLGFQNYAELSLATKMADAPDEVEAFLLDLARRARPHALAELQALQQYAQETDGLESLQPWDLASYTERMKAQRLGLADEQLRPYFEFSAVLAGLFGLIGRLYGLRIEPVQGVQVWHPNVSVHALLDPDGRQVGLFFLDPYARTDKRGGAWMDECRNRRLRQGQIETPVAYLVCNFRPPIDDSPALLTHDEVLTLFHEFGHGLHLLMTEVNEPALAGIHGVEWDAVELPSQFMENWAFDPATLNTFARHWQTGEPMPAELVTKLQASRVFQAGLATLRQIEFALFDLRLHRDYDPERGGRVAETLAAVRAEVAVILPPAYNRMPCSFSHVFAGGYAAGYYSYKWAEVLSADVFAAFEESNFAADTGRRFRDTVLANGGSKPARELFQAFRGRLPSIEALLRHNGLIDEAA